MKKGNPIALLPIGVFLVIYLGLGLLFEYGMKIPMGFYNIPIVIAFLVAILVACLQVNIDGMLRFADIFFDGLLTDLAVLDKIKLSHTQVKDTREQILTILRQLQDELEDVHYKLSRLQKEVDSLIFNAEL